MAGRNGTPRGVDPANSVTRALDARRGFTSQADVRETKHAVERLGVVGDNPNEIAGNLSVSGDITGGGDVLLQWPIGGDDKDVKIVGVEAGAETTYLHAHYEPDGFGVTFYNLWNNSGLFALGSTTTLNDAYIIVYAPAILRFWNAAAAETMSIDPETGTITTLGSIIQESAEASTTPVAGATSNTGVANIRRYMFFTLPTTEKWYVITGVEWLNKATVNGDIYFGVDLVDSNPPVSNESTLVAWGMRPQSGTNSAQKATRVSSHPIRGGTTVGAWIAPTSATATLGSTTVASANLGKNVTAGSPPNVDNTAWFATTAQYYIKAYYRGIR